jgi:hypothetical protein
LYGDAGCCALAQLIEIDGSEETREANTPTFQGQKGHRSTSREGFDVLGLEVRCVLDFGVGISDWRGAYLNAGA